MRIFRPPRLINGPFGDPALYVQLAHRREALLFDCGELQLLSARARLKIATVFISHCHIDHFIGFDTLLRQFLYHDAELTFCGPPGLIERIGARLASYSWKLVDQVNLVLRVREWGETTGLETFFYAADGFAPTSVDPVPTPRGLLCDTDAYQVRGVPLDHGGLTSLAFLLEEPLHITIHAELLAAAGLRPGPWLTAFKERLRSGPLDGTLLATDLDGHPRAVELAELAPRIAHLAPGTKLCYVTDVSPSASNFEAIIALASGADLLVIEAVFADAETDRARQRHHLTAVHAGTVARRAGVTRLLTFHHSPRYLDRPNLLSDEAQVAFRAPATDPSVAMHSALPQRLC